MRKATLSCVAAAAMFAVADVSDVSAMENAGEPQTKLSKEASSLKDRCILEVISGVCSMKKDLDEAIDKADRQIASGDIEAAEGILKEQYDRIGEMKLPFYTVERGGGSLLPSEARLQLLDGALVYREGAIKRLEELQKRGNDLPRDGHPMVVAIRGFDDGKKVQSLKECFNSDYLLPTPATDVEPCIHYPQRVDTALVRIFTEYCALRTGGINDSSLSLSKDAQRAKEMALEKAIDSVRDLVKRVEAAVTEADKELQKKEERSERALQILEEAYWYAADFDSVKDIGGFITLIDEAAGSNPCSFARYKWTKQKEADPDLPLVYGAWYVQRMVLIRLIQLKEKLQQPGSLLLPTSTVITEEGGHEKEIEIKSLKDLFDLNGGIYRYNPDLKKIIGPMKFIEYCQKKTAK